MFYEESILDNGVRIISERMDTVRSVAIGIWFKVGSRDELDGQYGLSHFMEHMFFKGTDTRDALKLSQDFESLGAEQNAFTSKEYTCYYARIVDDKLPQALELLADMLMNSQFADSEITSEREVVIEEIARAEDTPEESVFDSFSAAAWPGHELGRPIIGTRESVSAYWHADCAAYLQGHYHAGNCLVVACGNVDHQRLAGLCQEYLGGLPKKPAQTRRLEPLGQTPKRLEIVEKATEQAHLVYGLPGLALGDDDRFAGAILDAALGGGMSSRLFQEIREKRGLAYAVYASTMSFQALGSFFVYVGTRPANLEEAVGLIRIELLRILEEGITAEELARMQEYLIGNMVLGMESTASRMMRLGRNAVSGVPLYSLDETIERYRSVTMADTQRVAERVLTGSPTLAVISPREAATLEGVLSGLLEDQNKGARNDQGIV